jgi:hypothetical protein
MLQGLVKALREPHSDEQIGIWELNLCRAEITFFPGPTIGAHGKRSIPLRVFRRMLYPLDRRGCAMTLAQALCNEGPHITTSYRIRGCDGKWHLMRINGRITEYAHDGTVVSITGICSHDVPYRSRYAQTVCVKPAANTSKRIRLRISCTSPCTL